MGTEILRPQDCLINRMRVHPAVFPRRRSYNYGNHGSSNFNSNPRPNRKPAVRLERSDQRKRFSSSQSEPSMSKRSSFDDLKTAKNSPVMEKVMILRRGESLDSKIKSSEALKKVASDDLLVTDTGRLGPDPEMVPKQIRIMDHRLPFAGNRDMYAGSAFAVSPAPSSLPLPSFSKKKQVPIDDCATRDLRRLLRLDL